MPTVKLVFKKTGSTLPTLKTPAKAPGGLKFAKTAQSMVPKASLKYLLHNHLTGPEEARPLKNIHASELTKEGGVCPRYYALHDVTETKPKNQWMDTASAITYRMGNDLQDQLVEYFANMGRLVGDWRCLSCETILRFQKRPKVCECGCKTFAPEEVRMKGKTSGASCGLDMLVDLGRPKLTIVEVKTMIKTQFETLEAPLAEHRLRTNLYLRLVADSDDPNAQSIDTEKAKVLYVCKGGYKADPELKKWGLSDIYSPFKEYDVTRDDTVTDTLVRPAEAITLYRAKAVGMPCGVCATALDPRAKACAKKAVCFSGDYPPEFDWKAP